METLFQYFIKVNGLLIVFYLSYYFFLRKETFFQSNRWFLLLGIISSIVLPLITFTEIIWVNPEPIINKTNTFFPITNIATEAISSPFDWSSFFMYCYFLVSTSFLFKLVLELYSFFKIVKNGNQIKENNIVLVETNELQNPFSFFNYLVFNKSKFTEEELAMIIIHERIHIEQKHSIDVLISKLLCLFLWINPITWLYRKAILENLEFIADNQTAVITNKAYQYQKTLLKVVVCNNQLSITNQFYQSLIKKRIVMLNTNQSSKKNVWKYAVVFPLLVAFMLFFQVETVAQVKEKSKKIQATVVAVGFSIDKNATDAEMKSDSEELKKQGIDYTFSKVKRNKKGEIIAIKIEFNDNKGNKGVKEVKGDEPIEPIFFSTENNKIGFTFDSDFSDYIKNKKISEEMSTEVKVKRIITDNTDIYIDNKKGTQKDLDNLDPEHIERMDVNKVGDKSIIKVVTNKTPGKQTVYFINDENVSKKALDNLDPQNIKSMDVNKSGNDNIIRVITKNSAGIPDETEIYINGEKVSKEEFDELEQSEIKMMNIKEVNSKKIIEIQTNSKEEIERETRKIILERKEQPEREEMQRMKAELTKAKAEIQRTQAELEKAKADLKKKTNK
jgi:hypothetical protein